MATVFALAPGYDQVIVMAGGRTLSRMRCSCQRRAFTKLMPNTGGSLNSRYTWHFRRLTTYYSFHENAT